jgi:hypothetical protein
MFINVWPRFFSKLLYRPAGPAGTGTKRPGQVFILCVVFLTALLCPGCAATPTTPKPPVTTPSASAPATSPADPASNVTLGDSSQILDLLSILPEIYHRADDPDAANTQLLDGYMIAGTGWSQAEIFVSKDPFQYVRAYMNVAESAADRSALDRLFTDKERFKVFLERNLEPLLSDCSAVMDVTESRVVPDVLGGLALYGEGLRNNAFISAGFDALLFQQGNVYVFLCSLYYSPRETYLPDIGADVRHRISTWTR